MQRTGKCSLQMLRTCVFVLKVAWKPFSKKFRITKFWFRYFWTRCLSFPENALFERSEHIFLSSRFSKPFSRSFLWPYFYLNSFGSFASLSQKMVSTLSLKNFQKCEKRSFPNVRTFVFELKIAWKYFYENLAITKYWFK